MKKSLDIARGLRQFFDQQEGRPLMRRPPRPNHDAVMPPELLSGLFVLHAFELWRNYSDQLARATFRYSIWYLAALFTALVVDHYLK